jgi:hypothetical protein
VYSVSIILFIVIMNNTISFRVLIGWFTNKNKANN